MARPGSEAIPGSEARPSHAVSAPGAIPRAEKVAVPKTCPHGLCKVLDEAIFKCSLGIANNLHGAHQEANTFWEVQATTGRSWVVFLASVQWRTEQSERSVRQRKQACPFSQSHCFGLMVQACPFSHIQHLLCDCTCVC